MLVCALSQSAYTPLVPKLKARLESLLPSLF